MNERGGEAAGEKVSRDVVFAPPCHARVLAGKYSKNTKNNLVASAS
jgi:hypothetical protein